MFGFSLSELVVVIVVALVVIGPKDLPKMLRKLGQYAAKLRRMASELRAQSGIDDALRSEGLAEDLAEIRKLARGELDAVRQAATVDISGPPALTGSSSTGTSSTGSGGAYRDDFYVARDREYPRDGADAYGALPDNAIVYAEGLAKSALARDPLYVLGDENAVVPEPETPKPFGADESEAGPDASDEPMHVAPVPYESPEERAESAKGEEGRVLDEAPPPRPDDEPKNDADGSNAAEGASSNATNESGTDARPTSEAR